MEKQSKVQRLVKLRDESVSLHGHIVGSHSAETFSEELFNAIQCLNLAIVRMAKASEEYHRLTHKPLS